MSSKIRLSKRISGILLAMAVLLLVVISLILTFTIGKTSRSFAKLESAQNKFRLSFHIERQDQEKFSNTLEKLALPQSVKDGVEFELDATSSAKLAFLLPIESEIDFQDQSIQFEGKVDGQFLEEQVMEDFKLPPSTTLAVFALSFEDYLKTNFNLPQSFNDWLEKNVTNKGQYLVVFGNDSQFAVIFKSEQFNLEGLQNTLPNAQEVSYKEETQDAVTFHLIKLNTDDKNLNITPTFFQLGPWVFLASSHQAAKDLVDAQKSYGSNSITFTAKTKEPVSTAVLFLNSNETLPENFDKVFLSDAKPISKKLENFARFEFILKGKSFSGLINLK